jgi:methylated-DNA-[protein]-cysteine S-methyltransferase
MYSNDRSTRSLRRGEFFQFKLRLKRNSKLDRFRTRRSRSPRVRDTLIRGALFIIAYWEEAMVYSTHYSSPLGEILLASDGGGIVGLWFEGQKYYCDTITEAMTEEDNLPLFHAAKNWLDRYFSGRRPAVSELPLAPGGSAFRKAVWKILCETDYGEVTTYGEIARKMAARMNIRSMSAQAVGGAVGHNPISVIIPCHRVVGANGSLTGYAGGIEKKIRLLEREGVGLSRFTVPAKGTAL